MKQKRLYEEARIDVIKLSSKSQLLAESGTTLTSSARISDFAVDDLSGGFGSFSE